MNIPQVYLFDDPNNPSVKEIADFVAGLMKHSATVEFYLKQFGVVVDDGQHPHDLVGPGNKLEWEVLRGLALKTKDTPEKERRCKRAIELHRHGQYHHHKWNVYNPLATEMDLKYGAIDTIVSLREPRDYQGGIRTWSEIAELIKQNQPHKQPWMQWAMTEIKSLEDSTP